MTEANDMTKFRVVIYDDGPHQYCQRACVVGPAGRNPDCERVAEFQWTAGYGSPNEQARRDKQIARATLLAAMLNLTEGSER